MKFVLLSALFVLLTNSALAAKDSLYTSLNEEDCTTISLDNSIIDSYEGVCTGVDGYNIGVSGSDLRYSVTLDYKGSEIELPRLLSFHYPGAVAEWRYNASAKAKGGLSYNALIYRLNYLTYDDNGDPIDLSQLVVVRLNEEKSCVIGIVKNSKDMNIKARAIADDKSAKCIVF